MPYDGYDGLDALENMMYSLSELTLQLVLRLHIILLKDFNSKSTLKFEVSMNAAMQFSLFQVYLRKQRKFSSSKLKHYTVV